MDGKGNLVMLSKIALPSVVSLGGLFFALIVDIIIANNIGLEKLDSVVLLISLIVAYDVLIRESFRFSLLNYFNEENISKSVLYVLNITVVILVIVAPIYSLFFSVYTFDYVSLPLSFAISFWMFAALTISNVFILILTVKGVYVLVSIRNYLIPLALALLVFIDDLLFLLVIIAVLSSVFCLYSIYIVRKSINFSLKLDFRLISMIKRLLFPAASYGMLQGNRYFERSLLTSNAPGTSYGLYFSSKVYSAIITVVAIPVSMVVANKLAHSSSADKKDLIKVIMFTFFGWLLISTISMLLIYFDMFLILFTKDIAELLLSALPFYILAALFGSISMQLQAYMYKYSKHRLVLFFSVISNVLYSICLIFIGSMQDGIELVESISYLFCLYVLFEMLVYYYLLHSNCFPKSDKVFALNKEA